MDSSNFCYRMTLLECQESPALYMGEIVSLCTLLHSCTLQFNLLQSPIQWNVDFALVDEREKNRMREESHELGALISKL
jgi:hypothetical protein